MNGGADVYDVLGLSKAHAMIIGAFALIASAIEYYIELILLGLLGMDQRYGGATIRWVSTQQQIVMIRKILKEKHGEDSNIYMEMKARLDDAQLALEHRNEYVHSVYYLRPEDNYRVSPRRGHFDLPKLNIDFNEMQPAMVHATVAMNKLAQTATELGLPFPPPSHDTQTQQQPNPGDAQDQIP